MGYLDDVSGVYLTGEEVEKSGETTFEVVKWVKDSFKDGIKVVLVGKVNGAERRLVINRTRKGELLTLLDGTDESAVLGRTLLLGTYLTTKPGEKEKVPAISIRGFARK